MMASVFLMQAVAQITAYLVSLGVVMGLGPRLGLHPDTTDPEAARPAVDAIWRVIISVGAIPALLAIGLRRLLPETPRFLAERGLITTAMEETGRVYNVETRPVERRQSQVTEKDYHERAPELYGYHDARAPVSDTGGVLRDDVQGSSRRYSNDPGSTSGPPEDEFQHDYHNNDPNLPGVPVEDPVNENLTDTLAHNNHPKSTAEQLPGPKPKVRNGIWKDITGAKAYLSVNSRWRCFLGVIITWYLLDLSVCGLGLDSPKTIATMYLSSPSTELSCAETWRTDPSQPNISIYNMLQQNTLRNLQTITTGTLPGSIIILLVIDFVPRAAWMGWTFVALGGLFAITGSTLFVAYESDKHAMTVVFYVLTQLLNNLGPNTMTWILPAELFETKYRATFYGIAAAAGKLGAITIQIINKLLVSGKGKIPFAGLVSVHVPRRLLHLGLGS
jgi:MFS transporter, PHS family, inorganic phosphate transporter